MALLQHQEQFFQRAGAASAGTEHWDRCNHRLFLHLRMRRRTLLACLLLDTKMERRRHLLDN